MRIRAWQDPIIGFPREAVACDTPMASSWRDCYQPRSGPDGLINSDNSTVPRKGSNFDRGLDSGTPKAKQYGYILNHIREAHHAHFTPSPSQLRPFTSPYLRCSVMHSPAFARSPALKNGVSLPSEDLCATLFHTDQNQIVPANPGVFIPSTQITYRIHRPYLDRRERNNPTERKSVQYLSATLAGRPW
ncbi:hypothetical protein SBA4_280014 [Candidatus Sulfopaludibacter sp. SbA4]|nr:hypothetical protein SBA4_280014 [Candidatus Sulfopaludibacter sp. SbA4]